MRLVSINIYKVDELPEPSQKKAIEDHRIFLLSTMQASDFISGDPEYDTPDQLKAQFTEEYKYYLLHDTPIRDDLNANNYWFFLDGTLANCTTCTAGPDRGRTIFSLHGETDCFYEEEN